MKNRLVRQKNLPRSGIPPVSRQTAAPAEPAKEQPPSLRPSRDRYVPVDKPADPPAGLYRVAHDRDGTPRIAFDNPEAPVSPERPGDPGKPEKDSPAGKPGKEGRTVADTDKVDREIRSLKERRDRLEERLRTAGETERRDLERQLEQVDRELARKDNDTYRRQNTVFTEQ